MADRNCVPTVEEDSISRVNSDRILALIDELSQALACLHLLAIRDFPACKSNNEIPSVKILRDDHELMAYRQTCLQLLLENIEKIDCASSDAVALIQAYIEAEDGHLHDKCYAFYDNPFVQELQFHGIIPTKLYELTKEALMNCIKDSHENIGSNAFHLSGDISDVLEEFTSKYRLFLVAMGSSHDTWRYNKRRRIDHVLQRWPKLDAQLSKLMHSIKWIWTIPGSVDKLEDIVSATSTGKEGSSVDHKESLSYFDSYEGVQKGKMDREGLHESEHSYHQRYTSSLEDKEVSHTPIPKASLSYFDSDERFHQVEFTIQGENIHSNDEGEETINTTHSSSYRSSSDEEDDINHSPLASNTSKCCLSSSASQHRLLRRKGSLKRHWDDNDLRVCGSMEKYDDNDFMLSVIMLHRSASDPDLYCRSRSANNDNEKTQTHKLLKLMRTCLSKVSRKGAFAPVNLPHGDTADNTTPVTEAETQYNTENPPEGVASPALVQVTQETSSHPVKRSKLNARKRSATSTEIKETSECIRQSFTPEKQVASNFNVQAAVFISHSNRDEENVSDATAKDDNSRTVKQPNTYTESTIRGCDEEVSLLTNEATFKPIAPSPCKVSNQSTIKTGPKRPINCSVREFFSRLTKHSPRNARQTTTANKSAFAPHALSKAPPSDSNHDLNIYLAENSENHGMLTAETLEKHLLETSVNERVTPDEAYNNSVLGQKESSKRRDIELWIKNTNEEIKAQDCFKPECAMDGVLQKSSWLSLYFSKLTNRKKQLEPIKHIVSSDLNPECQDFIPSLATADQDVSSFPFLNPECKEFGPTNNIPKESSELNPDCCDFIPKTTNITQNAFVNKSFNLDPECEDLDPYSKVEASTTQHVASKQLNLNPECKDFVPFNATAVEGQSVTEIQNTHDTLDVQTTLLPNETVVATTQVHSTLGGDDLTIACPQLETFSIQPPPTLPPPSLPPPTVNAPPPSLPPADMNIPPPPIPQSTALTAPPLEVHLLPPPPPPPQSTEAAIIHSVVDKTKCQEKCQSPASMTVSQNPPACSNVTHIAKSNNMPSHTANQCVISSNLARNHSNYQTYSNQSGDYFNQFTHNKSEYQLPPTNCGKTFVYNNTQMQNHLHVHNRFGQPIPPHQQPIQSVFLNNIQTNRGGRPIPFLFGQPTPPSNPNEVFRFNTPPLPPHTPNIPKGEQRFYPPDHLGIPYQCPRFMPGAPFVPQSRMVHPVQRFPMSIPGMPCHFAPPLLPVPSRVVNVKFTPVGFNKI